MEQKKEFTKTWIFLYSVVSILFSVIGLVMIFLDSNYFNGSQYLITAIVFGAAAFLIKTSKVKPNFSNPMINLGFIFSIIGLVDKLGPSFWVLGTLFFFWGLFYKNE